MEKLTGLKVKGRIDHIKSPSVPVQDVVVEPSYGQHYAPIKEVMQVISHLHTVVVFPPHVMGEKNLYRIEKEDIYVRAGIDYKVFSNNLSSPITTVMFAGDRYEIKDVQRVGFSRLYTGKIVSKTHVEDPDNAIHLGTPYVAFRCDYISVGVNREGAVEVLYEAQNEFVLAPTLES